jgi:hypothetical protein
MAESHRPRCLLHEREELDPGLGFCGKGAYRGRRGQARAGIGRGDVGGGEGGLRWCMQELGLARGLRGPPDVYGNGDIGSVSSCTSSIAK